MAVPPMQIVVISCVVFFSYITERVPTASRFGWINFRSLSLLLLVSLDLSFLGLSRTASASLFKYVSLFCFLSLFPF